MSDVATVAEQQAMVMEFLDGLIDKFGIAARAEATHHDEESFEVNIVGESPELGLLIGPRGRHIVALQEVSKTLLQRHMPPSERVRVRVDVGNYRARRADALEAYVRELAERVLERGIEAGLEPMNAADRKVVHNTVNGIDGVATISVGEDPRRRVVIVPADR